MLQNSLVSVELCKGQEVFRNPFPKTRSMTLMFQSRVKLIYWQQARERPVQVFRVLGLLLTSTCLTLVYPQNINASLLTLCRIVHEVNEHKALSTLTIVHEHIYLQRSFFGYTLFFSLTLKYFKPLSDIMFKL